MAVLHCRVGALAMRGTELTYYYELAMDQQPDFTEITECAEAEIT